MDHVDWQGLEHAEELAQLLARQVGAPCCLPLSAYMTLSCFLACGQQTGNRQVCCQQLASQAEHAAACLMTAGVVLSSTPLLQQAGCSDSSFKLSCELLSTPAPPQPLMLPTALAPQQTAAEVGQHH